MSFNDTTEAQILAEHASMVEIPKPRLFKGANNRRWLVKTGDGWRLFTTYGPSWIYNFTTSRWEITIGMSSAKMTHSDYVYPTLLGAFKAGCAITSPEERLTLGEPI